MKPLPPTLAALLKRIESGEPVTVWVSERDRTSITDAAFLHSPRFEKVNIRTVKGLRDRGIIKLRDLKERVSWVYRVPVKAYRVEMAAGKDSGESSPNGGQE